MSRAPRAVPSRLRRKRVLKAAKGFYGRRKNTITVANAAVDRSMQHNYVGRKLRKRNFRALWIQRINAASRANGLTYNRLIQGLKAAEVEVDRRMLAELAVSDANAFAALVKVAKDSLPADTSAPAVQAEAAPAPKAAKKAPAKKPAAKKADAEAAK